MSFNLVTILGPTAVGKTGLAAQLAYRYNGEIISADSRQVYKGMDIGTGKDLSDYLVNDQKIPYHLIDLIEPTEEFNLFLFQKHFYKSFKDISARGKLPFLVGGTGLYIDSVLREYNLTEVEFSGKRLNELDQYNLDDLRNMLKKINPNLHNTTDLVDKDRIIKAIIISEMNNLEIMNSKPEISSLTFGIKLSRQSIKENITKRLKMRLEAGMIDEVKDLLEKGIGYNKLISLGLEYKYICMFVKGELNYNDMFQKLNSAIHNFAKRQMTWFRKMEKEGIVINWLNGADLSEAEKIIDTKYYNKH